MGLYSFMVTDGPDLGRTFDLEPGLTIVGRLKKTRPYDPEGSRRWGLIDKTVSRSHIMLEWHEPGAPIMKHLSETNFTYIDGTLVEETILSNGQTIRMGQTTMEVQFESEWVDGSPPEWEGQVIEIDEESAE